MSQGFIEAIRTGTTAENHLDSIAQLEKPCWKTGQPYPTLWSQIEGVSDLADD